MPLSNPLEFKECVVFSPHFQYALHVHTRELKNSGKKIKDVILSSEKLFRSMEQMQQAYKEFAAALVNCFSTDDSDSVSHGSNNSSYGLQSYGNTDPAGGIGETEDDKTIKNSFNVFSEILCNVEESRMAILHPIRTMVMKEIHELRDAWLIGSKTDPKIFAKDTLLFNQKVEKYVSTKSKEATHELDEMMKRDRYKFIERSLEYVTNIHEAEELKKSKFVQTITLLMNMLHTFYHQAYEHFRDYQGRLSTIHVAAQRSSDTFNQITEDTKLLKEKILQTEWENIQIVDAPGFREGYVFVPTKKAVATQWVKHFCAYSNEKKILTLLPYSQGRSTEWQTRAELYNVTSCIRRASDSIDRRFCFDVEVDGKSTPMTLQAQSLADMTEWLYVMGGTEPVYAYQKAIQKPDKTVLNEDNLIALCDLLEAIESRDLQTPGVYRISGVTSKIRALIQQTLTPPGLSKSAFENVELNTLTGGVKYFLRYLEEPLLTYCLHDRFLAAIKMPPELHVSQIQQLLQLLPKENLKTLRILMFHLDRVAQQSNKNNMPASNLAIVFAPTLLRSDKETVAAIMNTKFASLVIELLIKHCSTFFEDVAEASSTLTSSPPVIRFEKLPVPKKPAVLGDVADIATATANNTKFVDVHKRISLIEPIYSTPILKKTVEIPKAASSQDLRSRPGTPNSLQEFVASYSDSAQKSDGNLSSSWSSRSSLVNRISTPKRDKGPSLEVTSSVPCASQRSHPDRPSKARRQRAANRRTMTTALFRQRATNSPEARSDSTITAASSSIRSEGRSPNLLELRSTESRGGGKSNKLFKSLSTRPIRRNNIPQWEAHDISTNTSTDTGVQASPPLLKPERPPRPHLPVNIRRKSMIACLENSRSAAQSVPPLPTHRMHAAKRTSLIPENPAVGDVTPEG